MLPNHVPHCGKYKILSSVPLSCVPLVIFAQKREPYILFFIQYFIDFSSDCSVHFPLPQAFLLSLPVLFSLSQTWRQTLLPACRKSKHSHNSRAFGWRESSHMITGCKLGTYFSVFTLLRYNTFCSYWMRMIKENEKHIQTFEFKENINFGHEVSHFTLVNIQRCFQVLML